MMNTEAGNPNEQRRSVPFQEYTLQRKYIDLILSGEKTVEGRINSGGFARVRVGERIKFFDKRNQNSSVICEVTGIGRYRSFREMLIHEGVTNMIPDAESLEEAESIYNRISSYSQRAKQNGVLALRIKVVC